MPRSLRMKNYSQYREPHGAHEANYEDVGFAGMSGYQEFRGKYGDAKYEDVPDGEENYEELPFQTADYATADQVCLSASFLLFDHTYRAGPPPRPMVFFLGCVIRRAFRTRMPRTRCSTTKFASTSTTTTPPTTPSQAATTTPHTTARATTERALLLCFFF
jgi:hypothetical protein